MIKLNDLARKTASFRKKAPEGRYLNLKEIICLGGAGLGVSFICNLINMYVTIGQMPLIYDMGDFGTLHATIIYLVACVGGLVLTPVYGICDNVIRADGHGGAELLEAIIKLIPLGTYAEWNVAYMQHCKGDKYPAITDTYTKILKEEEGEAVKVKRLERFYFYEQAKKSRFVLATGEGALYANVIIKKGVVK